ncbi:MAG: ammonia-forming cytochrome c nitrite reductase subunit c552, partial [Bacteroidales bacterium]|nr:ammonia-forming cytochrome c nitrite reductase subunit c552 [Bacteroidales bacterium]
TFTRQEMRTVVCANCHVEYYFAGEGKYLTFPWENGTKIEDIARYYQEIDFKRPFKRITMIEAIKESTGYDIEGLDENGLRDVAASLKVEVTDTMGKGRIIDEIFGEKAEPHLIQPTFVIDYPVEMSPLCKKHRENPELTERFELMVNGKELCNAYTELNDPIDQLERFKDQMILSEKGDDEAMFIDMDFVRALEYGMPPTSGMGLGMDRLVMLMTNQTSIQEVLLFPQMKPEKSAKGPVVSAQEEYKLSEDEKLVLDILKDNSPVDLNTLKGQTGLSNKKWDKAIKGLSNNNLAKVEKTDKGLLVELL